MFYMSTMTLEGQPQTQPAKADGAGFDRLAMIAVAIMLLAFVAAVIGGVMESELIILGGILLTLGLVVPLYLRGVQSIETE